MYTDSQIMQGHYLAVSSKAQFITPIILPLTYVVEKIDTWMINTGYCGRKMETI